MSRRRMMMQAQEVEDMELNAPQLLVEDTISEVKNSYSWSDPKLRKCRWLLITVKQPTEPTSTPYMHLKINNRTITQVSSVNTAAVFIADSTRGFWIAKSASNPNAANLIDVSGNINFLGGTKLKDFVKYEPIESVMLWSYTSVLSVGTIVKIYGC